MKLLIRNSLAGCLTVLLLLGVLMPSGSALADDTPDINATKRLALHGNAQAQNALATMYAKGQGVARDYSQAHIWYQKAAEQGHGDAQFNLGDMYHKGEGVSQDYTQAIDWYRKAVEQGHKAAQSEMEKIQNNIAALKKMAEQGKVESMVALADLYANGNGVPQDYGQAVRLYRKAAEQGDAAAQCKLGFLYAEGKGISQDFAQSVVWYRKAIDQDYAPAKYALGSMYFTGKGVTKDKVQAYAWLSLAAAQGDANATINKEFAASKLTPEQLTAAQTLAAQFQVEIDTQKQKPTLPTGK